MKFTFTLAGYEVPSQNVTMRRHWRVNHTERVRLERWVRSLVGRTVPPADSHRGLHVLAIRKRLITDDANLRGGCKGLVDAIVAAGLLLDDADAKAHITYGQQTLSQAQRTKPATTLTIDIP